MKNSNNYLKSFFRSGFGTKISVFLISASLLFAGFYSNLWEVANQQWFDTFMKDTEAHVVGRMVKSNTDGVFSAGGLLGIAIPTDNINKVSQPKIQIQNSQEDWDEILEYVPFQYDAFTNHLQFDSYVVYMSQTGGQGMVFSLVNLLFPDQSVLKLEFFYILTSLLSALALSLIILWFYSEFGLCVSLVVLIATILSQWLDVFGRNLWWNLWAFYLPMILIANFLKIHKAEERGFFLKLSGIVIVAVIIKYLFNGMEYITTALIMMMIPFVFYSVLHKYSLRHFIMGSLVSVLASFVAVFFCLIILSIQIAAVKGNFSDGVDHIVFSLLSRTHGSAEGLPAKYADDLNSNTMDVVLVYLNGAYFDFNNYPSLSHLVPKALVKVRYSYLLLLFIIASLVLPVLHYKTGIFKMEIKAKALLIATWVSIAAPMSWFIIFKAHSHVHIHVNYVLWQMPFTLFGFALCGFVFNKTIKMIRDR